MQVVLVMFTADGAQRKFPLMRDITVIGRREDCDLRIPLTEISRKHCRIVKSGGTVRLEDLGSSNGTFHNGARVSESDLSPGDRVQLGPVIFTLQVDGVPADDMITLPQSENDHTSAGAELEISGEGEQATGVVRATSPLTPAALAGRPLAPQGDDFSVTAENEAQDEDELVDLHPISPQEDEKDR